MIMNEMLDYISKMNTYIESKDYDSFIKEINYNDEKYCCFEEFFNKIDEKKIRNIVKQVIQEKIQSLGLELREGYYSGDGLELIYSDFVFGNIKIEEKKLILKHSNLNDIKKYLFNIKCSLSKIEYGMAKFKKLQQNEIEVYLESIRRCCERLVLPDEEWTMMEKKVRNQFQKLGFEVIEVTE